MQPGGASFSDRLQVQVDVLNSSSAVFNKSGGDNDVEFSGTFTNSGTVSTSDSNDRIIFSGASTHDGTSNLTMVSNGRLQFQTSTHDFNGANFSGTGTAIFSGGTSSFNSGTYNNAGTTQVSGGTTTFDINMDTGALTVSGTPLLNGSGDYNVTGLTTWTGSVGGSTIGGSGTLNANGGLNLAGTTQLNWSLDRNAVIGGSSSWNVSGNDTKTFSGTGAITNNGIIDIDASGAGGGDFLSITVDFVNNGTLTKSGGSNNAQFSGLFDNDGIVNANDNDDVLEFSGGGTHTGTFAGSGLLEFGGGTHDINSGTFNIATGTTIINGGTVNFNNVAGSTSGFTHGGGILDASGSGKLTVNGAWAPTSGVVVDGTLELASTASLFSFQRQYCGVDRRLWDPDQPDQWWQWTSHRK